MIRSGVPTNQAGNISDSDSDWDTTVEFPSPRQGGDAGQDSGDEIPPTPRTRSTIKLKDDSSPPDPAGAPPVYGRREESAPPSARREKTAVSSSNILLSAQSGSGGSRNPSPVPPYTTGFRDAIQNGSDVETSRADPPPGRDRKGNIYDPAPQQNLARKSSGGFGSWDDSDAEQRTLRELHTTLRKEKNREIEHEAARLQTHPQDAGDASPATGRSTSVLEKWMQGREDKRRQKDAQDSSRSAVISQHRKTGISSPPIEFSPREDNNDNAVPPGLVAPYRSMVVKDPDGKRYLYYFNEGSTAFFEVEEVDSDAIMPKVAEKVETYVRRGWQEFFGALRIVTSIAILLAVEAVNYAINHIASPIFLGVVTSIGNRLLKPLLAAAFNLLLQPVIIFSWNVLSGIRHVFQPVVDVLGAVMSKLAILVQAFRLVEVNLGEDYLLRHKKVIGLGSGARHNIEVV